MFHSRFVGFQWANISYVDWITSSNMVVKILSIVAAFLVLKFNYRHKCDAQGHFPGDRLCWTYMTGWGDEAFEIPRHTQGRLHDKGARASLYSFREQKCH